MADSRAGKVYVIQVWDFKSRIWVDADPKRGTFDTKAEAIQFKAYCQKLYPHLTFKTVARRAEQ
jgi:hypothetical protein